MGPRNAESNEQHRQRIQQAKSFLQEAVGDVPTAFGKLAWISSRRVYGLDEYVCASLEEVVPSEIASRELRNLHRQLFRKWLGLRLEEQVKDLAEYVEYLRSRDEERKQFLRLSQSEENLIPPGTNRAERYQFETDFAVVLELSEK